MSQAVARAERTEAVPRSAGVSISLVTVAVTALVVGAFVLRLVSLDRESLWLDEGYTLLFSGLPLPRLLTVGGAHEHPPLYYLLVHGLMQLWPSYLVPRVLAAVAGALSVPALYFLGRRVHSSIAGLVAAALLTLSPFHVWYSQDARAYELAGLWVLLSYLSLFAASESGSRGPWAAYASCTLLALYTEYTAVLVVVPQALFLLRARRALLISWLVILAGYLPWIGVLWRDTASVAGDYWIPPPTVDQVVTTALEFLGFTTSCPASPCTGQTVAPVAGHESAVVAIALALLVGVSVWLWRRAPFTITVLMAWLLAPFAIVLPLAAVRSLYLDRIFLDATFPLYLIAGMAFAWTVRAGWWRVPAVLALVLLIAGNAWGARLVYGDASNPDWRSLARDLSYAYRPGQSVMFNPGVLRSLVGAYLPTGWHATRERALWSRSYLDVPGWQASYPQAVKPDDESRARTEALLRERQLRDVTRGVDQAWLVVFDYPGLNDTRRWFAEHGFQPVLSQLYAGDTRLELWSRTDPSSFGPQVTPRLSISSWQAHGRVRVSGMDAALEGAASLSRSFPVRPGVAYSARVEYRGAPPSGPAVTVQVFDGAGRLLGLFPHTMWYELPVPGVWLDQPFGFVAPPGASRAVITLGNRWGQVRYRHVAVFAER